MKNRKLLFTLLLFPALLFLMNFVQTKDLVTVTVRITNDNNLPFENGILTIKETGEQFEINEVKDFEIKLKEGKYHFKFKSETSHAILYPSKIKKEDNWVYIKLGSTSKVSNGFATAENIDSLMKNGEAQFILFGMVSDDYSTFKEKYGIGVKTENCVITPYLSKIAKENNLVVAQYLNENFGNSWKQDLKINPFGLE